MTKRITLGLTLVLSLIITSCYKDQSKMMSKDVPQVTLDTVGIPAEQYIGYQETLTISPKLPNITGQNLSYKWEISESVETERSTTMKTIGDALELNYKVERPIATAPYRLRLTITDNANGKLETIYSWPVYVRSAYITGLAVAHTRDGVTSDISYAKNKNISRNYTQDQVVMHDILGESGKIKDLVTSLWYSSLGRQWRPHTSQLWVVTQSGKALRYDTKDFSVNGDSDKTNLIIYKPEGFKFLSIFSGAESLFAHTNMGVYSLLSEVVNTFSTTDVVMTGQKFSGNVIAGEWGHNRTINNLVWFDEDQGKFLSRTKPKTAYTIGHYDKTDAFDPNRLPNNTALAGVTSADHNTVSFLLKDKASGEYAIYEMTQFTQVGKDYNPGIAKGRYKIPASFKTIMDNAKSYVFSKRNNILYVASDNKLYAVTYGLGSEATPNMTPIYTLPSGESLSSMQLYVQGEYRARTEEIEYRFVRPELSYNLNAITIVSQKGEYDGVIRIIKFAGQGETIDPAEINTFEGFGKILDVIGIGM